MSFCQDNFVLIKPLGSGAFGEVYQIYDLHLNKYAAVKISKMDSKDLESEINIIREISNRNIPNVTKYYGDGYCSLLNGKRYYEMDLQDEKLQTFISNGNKLTISQFYDMVFELLFTLSYFRLNNFKHRDLSTFNILYKINPIPRVYRLFGKSEKTVIINSNIQPIFSDFNTSVFENSDINNPLDFNDILAILDVISVLFDITSDISESDIMNVQNLIDQITINDDLSYEFVQNILNDNF